MHRFTLLLVTLVVSGCQDTPVQSELAEIPSSPGLSVLGAGDSGLFEACFDPSEGVCFDILSIQTELEEDLGSVWVVRTNVELRLKGRALPITPLRQHSITGVLTAQRSSGGGQSVSVASGTVKGDLKPGRSITLTGRNGFRKSDFALPIRFEISQFVGLSVGIQTPDAKVWPSYSCEIAEGTCYTGP